MNQCKSISEVSAELKITSRTLRHWEDKGLFCSQRNPSSSWRMYSDEAINRINLTFIFRELDIPLKDIKTIIDSSNPQIATKILENQINTLNDETDSIIKKKNLLYRCISIINSLHLPLDSPDSLTKISQTLAPELPSTENLLKGEDIVMTSSSNLSKNLRIITLPSMRVAVCNVVSQSPEDEALDTIVKWAEGENLMGTGKIFGFNTTNYSPQSCEYGWAASITVPEQIEIPDYLEEKCLPGGLYAALNSTNEVYDSWQTLTKLLKENTSYAVDTSRHCLEEHIANGDGSGYYLTLLEPICLKQK